MSSTTKPTLILASSSPRRRELIQLLGLPVTIRNNDVDETMEREITPVETVKELSTRKARAAFEQIKGSFENGVIVGSDTVVVYNGKILSKPENKDDAFRMLKLLQGNTHDVYSGIACIETVTGENVVNHSVTQVTMKPLTDEQIRSYIQTGEPMDKAGAYAVQGLGATFVEKINGDYFTVVGLPLALLSDMLKDFGIDVLQK